MGILGLVTVFPLVWMFFTSLHPPRSPIPSPGTLFAPSRWAFDNYAHVLTLSGLPVARFLLNSILVTSSVVLLQLTLCSLAAYGFSRLSFRGRNALFAGFLLTMMVPGAMLVVPLFFTVHKLGWMNTYLGLIVPYPYVSAAFGTFLLRQFFLTLPRSLDEAARIDGASEFRVFWHIILPSSKPALATLGAFAFLWTWTEFYWPMLATSSVDMRTLEVGLSVFKDAYGGTDWPLQMTAAVIVIAPALCVFLGLQRYFVQGVVLSGLKA
jgi:multiple sugar transport system permease protein